MSTQLRKQNRGAMLLICSVALLFLFLFQASSWAGSTIPLSAEERQAVEAKEVIVREQPTNETVC